MSTPPSAELFTALIKDLQMFIFLNNSFGFTHWHVERFHKSSMLNLRVTNSISGSIRRILCVVILSAYTLIIVNNLETNNSFYVLFTILSLFIVVYEAFTSFKQKLVLLKIFRMLLHVDKCLIYLGSSQKSLRVVELKKLWQLSALFSVVYFSLKFFSTSVDSPKTDLPALCELSTKWPDVVKYFLNVFSELIAVSIKNVNFDLATGIIILVYCKFRELCKVLTHLSIKDVDEIPGNVVIYAMAIRCRGEAKVRRYLQVSSHTIHVLCETCHMINDLMSSLLFYLLITMQLEMLYGFYFILKADDIPCLYPFIFTFLRLLLLIQACRNTSYYYNQSIALMNQIDPCLFYKQIQAVKNAKDLQCLHMKIQFEAGHYSLDFTIFLGIIAFVSTLLIIIIQIEAQQSIYLQFQENATISYNI